MIAHLSLDIQLYTYSYFSNNHFILNAFQEERKQKSSISANDSEDYDYESHRNKLDEDKRQVLDKIKEKILSLGEDIEENTKKYYVGFRSSVQNFVWLHPQKHNLKIHVRIRPQFFKDTNQITKEIPEKYLWGKNIKEFSVSSLEDIKSAIEIIEQAYKSSFTR